MQETPSLPSTGHLAYDVIIGLVVLLLGLMRLFEVLRTWGVLPEKQESRIGSNSKTVGQIRIETLETIVRREVEDGISRAIDKNQENHSENLAKLNDIVNALTRIATILDERRSHA